jgi:hypothetical protein
MSIYHFYGVDVIVSICHSQEFNKEKVILSSISSTLFMIYIYITKRDFI